MNKKLLILERLVSYFSKVLQTIRDYSFQQASTMGLQQAVLKSVTQLLGIRPNISSSDCNSPRYGAAPLTDKNEGYKINYKQCDFKNLHDETSAMKMYQIHLSLLILERQYNFLKRDSTPLLPILSLLLAELRNYPVTHSSQLYLAKIQN